MYAPSLISASGFPAAARRSPAAGPRPARHGPAATRPRPAPQRRACGVQAFHKDERSGIHDPAGPAGSWGQGERVSRREHAAQEESFQRQGAALGAEDARAERRHGSHPAGHVGGLDRQRQVGAEMAEVAEERADAAADEEYSHMGRLQKWALEAKAWLYAWLKTGVEPL